MKQPIKRPKIIVSVTNDLATDQRVHKVCTYLEQRGYEVFLVGRLLKDSLALERTYATKRFRLPFTKGALFYASYSLRLFWFLLWHKADYLLANDLDTLLPNYLISKIKRRITLVYDSHEYFTEVPELLNRPRVRNFWLGIEKRIVPKLDKLYTVSPSIAEKYYERYKKNFLVIRNVAPAWIPGELKSKSELGIPEDKFILIFQGAGINIDRGGEEITLAMNSLPQCCLLFVGSGDAIPSIKSLVEKEGLNNVLFFGKRPYAELMNFTWHADLGLSLDKGTNENYQFALPNKVFDYIQTHTPILASPMLEIKKLIEKHALGRCLEEVTVDNLVKHIEDICANPNQMEEWKNNCVKAAKLENWETEVQQLNEIYPAHG